ncbi:hypothetical protein F5Y06DRAFT_268452 [Hypoxylon sp. FL0890]|nr:hypothetical protein F5Y06DRAFT_268452 [Hypoxylon sp. FL0890]
MRSKAWQKVQLHSWAICSPLTSHLVHVEECLDSFPSTAQCLWSTSCSGRFIAGIYLIAYCHLLMVSVNIFPHFHLLGKSPNSRNVRTRSTATLPLPALVQYDCRNSCSSGHASSALHFFQLVRSILAESSCIAEGHKKRRFRDCFETRGLKRRLS